MPSNSDTDNDSASTLNSGPMVELSPRWIRVKFGGKIIADSKRVLLLRQYGPGRLPTYCFPQEDVRTELLKASSDTDQASDVAYWTIKVSDRAAINGAWKFMNPPAQLAELRGYVSFTWNEMDAWYEEEEEVFVHARDPYKRVDVIASSRHVRVVINGETIADTRRPYLLFETGLPTRFYIPQQDVRMALMEASALSTRCPYKGIAAYWSAKIGDQVVKNIVWSYPDPISECPKIKGLMSFLNENVDLYIDDQLS